MITINKKDKIQCLECGNYFKAIINSHLKKCSAMTMFEYKEKYPNIKITSEETCKKISKYQKGKEGKPRSDETKKKIGDANRGKKRSDEYKKNMSIIKKGTKFTDEHKKKIGDAHRGKEVSEETRQKLRISRLKEIEEKHGYIYPNFNINACNFFDKLNKTLGWNGQHALNGGEFHIKELGYFVDYYEPNLNIVIEWDEKKHKHQKQKDKIRQEEIENYLGCKFIRIDEDNIDIDDFESFMEERNNE